MSNLKYEFKPLYLLSDGWPFWEQPDGTLCDAPNPADQDLGWDSLDQLYNMDQDAVRGSVSDHVRFAEMRTDGIFPWDYSNPEDLAADLELITWYRGNPS